MTTHLIIPDTQIQPGVDLSYLAWIGEYAAEHRPDRIIHIGDAADMKSLSSYDKGKLSAEGRRYQDDLDSVDRGFKLLMDPIQREVQRRIVGKKKRWNPDLHLTLGNHENRINRFIDEDPKMEGRVSIDDLPFAKYGFKVHPFLQPVVLDGIAYAHYFTSGVMGRPVASARQLVQKRLMSCVMGHVQNWDIHRAVRGDGTAVLGVFVGSCYLHDEEYLGTQGNTYDRGIWMFHEVKDGAFHPMYVSLDYLRKRYA